MDLGLFSSLHSSGVVSGYPLDGMHSSFQLRRGVLSSSSLPPGKMLMNMIDSSYLRASDLEFGPRVQMRGCCLRRRTRVPLERPVQPGRVEGSVQPLQGPVHPLKGSQRVAPDEGVRRIEPILGSARRTRVRKA